MKKFSKELISGSLILFICFNIFNLLNLIFNFASARLLGPSDYGILAALMGLVLIFSIPNEAIQTAISRQSISFFIENKKEKIKGLLSYELFYFFKIAFFSFILFSLLSILILKEVFSVESKLLIVTGLFLFGALLVPVTRGVLQGTKRFNSLGISYIIEGAVKLALAVALIFMGWKAYGAMLGVVIGILASFLLSFLSLRDFIKVKAKNVAKEKIEYIPSILSIAPIMIFFTLDIILAKAFFSSEIAGYYAAVSNLGKAIFLGTWGIGRAMFSLASEKHDKKESPRALLEQTFMFIFFISLIIFALYMMFHRQIIFFVYGKEYLEYSWLLVYPSFAMVILSLSNVFVLYNLCIKKPKKNYVILLSIVAQIILLSVFHSTVLDFSMALIASSLILFLSVIATSFGNFSFRKSEKV